MKYKSRAILIFALVSFCTEFQSRMEAQTRVAVRLRANDGQYLSVLNGVVSTSSDRLEPAQFFAFLDRNGSGLQSGHSLRVRAGNGAYLILGRSPDGKIFANEITDAPAEIFVIVKVSGGSGTAIQSGDAIALRANNGQYVAAQGGVGTGVKANQSAIGPSSTFVVDFLSSAVPAGAAGPTNRTADQLKPSEASTAPLAPSSVTAVVTGTGSKTTKRDRKTRAAPVSPQNDSVERQSGPSGSPVSGLSGIAPGPTTVVLKWNGPPNNLGYLVWRDLSLLTKSPTPATTFTDTELRPKTTYTYTVVANRYAAPGITTPPSGTSLPGPAPSTVIVATPPGLPPGQPTAVYVESKAIALTWWPSPNASAYTVFRNGAPISPPVTATTYTDEQPIHGSNTYEVAVHYSVDSYGRDVWGDKSPAVTLQGPIWGYADTHNHQFAYLAFGGRFVVGQVFDSSNLNKEPDAIKRALHHCDYFFWPPSPMAFHGPWGTLDWVGDLIEVSYKVAAHGLGAGGYPEFDMWPRWNSINHQQEYYQWLKRAHDGGLQLLVMDGVNSEYLCSKVAQLPGLGCYDMMAVDLQLDMAANLEQFIDQQSGGPGTGWYRIVRTPSEARQAINNGQLAVLLGIEVADLFGCGTNPAQCTETYVSGQLQKYYDKGVRTIYAIHGTNNAFGGTGIFQAIYLLANIQMSEQIFPTYDCSSEFGVEYSLDKDNTRWLALLDAFGHPVPLIAFTLPHEKGTCNALGLTPLGKSFVTAMMKKHMIIDIDHMSYRGIDDALTIAENKMPPFLLGQGNPYYPAVISAHSGYIETSVGEKRSEGQKSRAQLTRIHGLGGMAGVITAQGQVSTSPMTLGIGQYTSPDKSQSLVKNDCSSSSKTFAQAYQYAVEKFGGPDRAAVGLATDIMGGIDQPGPRYGPNIYGFDDSCFPDHQPQAPEQRLRYPFTLPGIAEPFYESRACEGPDQNEQTTDCRRTFDFNTDGLAHIGMLPDFVADLRNLGVNTDPLFRSAEHYIEMWEKAELWPATSSSLTWVPPPPHSLYVSLKYDNATPQGGAVTAYAADWNTGAGVVGTLTVSGVQEPLGVPIPYMMAAGSGTGFAGKGTYGGLVPPVAVISAPGYTSTTVNLAPPTFLIQLQLKRTVQPGAREPCGDTVHGRGCQAPPTITLIVAAVDAQTGAPITNGQFTIAGEVAKFGQSVNYLECLPPCIGIARAPGYQDAQFNDAKQLN